MNKKTFVVLGAIVAAGSILAAPGGFRGSPHGSPHGGPRGPRGCSPAPRMSGGFRPPVSHGPAPRMGGFHAPFMRPPCGFRYPRGYHIGARHIAILPPAVLINDYYWTEEVFINGQYFILYCYPDGTKRFADGTIYCYI